MSEHKQDPEDSSQQDFVTINVNLGQERFASIQEILTKTDMTLNQYISTSFAFFDRMVEESDQGNLVVVCDTEGKTHQCLNAFLLKSPESLSEALEDRAANEEAKNVLKDS